MTYPETRLKGLRLTPAQRVDINRRAAKSRQAREASRRFAAWEREFGTFTSRELRLIAMVGKEAYQRGYNAAYHTKFSRAVTKERAA